ncbi:MAG: hypothetical protein DDT42_01891 [candidate division WS2 bacterium]|uniref:Uncharacterized protein n=1 Tax=Psychracetigena formicireducens TaxID=2986056 RepID=A0A9E2BI80_PSYF1|nr:hypothetical protein [Candidatus Psychracetigena formicireducens]
MSKIFYASSIDGNTAIKGLVGGGIVLKFSTSGKYLGELSNVFSAGGLSEVDAISILHSGGVLEVGISVGGYFHKTLSPRTLADLMNFCNGLNGLVFIGRRVGCVGEVSYTQYIYSYRIKTLNLCKLLEVVG